MRAVVIALWVLVGCSKKDDHSGAPAGTVTQTGTGTGATGTGAGTGADTGTGTGASGTGTGAATGTGTGATGTGTGATGTGTGTGAPALVPRLTGHSFYVNCMPAVPPDPVIGGFSAEYDNSAGALPEIATITTASLVFAGAGPAPLVWNLAVNPADSGSVAAGATSLVNHTKTGGNGPGSPCSYCSDTWSLDVTWDIGGQAVVDSLAMGSVYCVF